LTEIIEDTFAVMSEILGRFSWWLLGGSLAIVMSLFAWVALFAPGPVLSFYRIITATTIIVATGILEYFIIRLEKDLSK